MYPVGVVCAAFTRVSMGVPIETLFSGGLNIEGATEDHGAFQLDVEDLLVQHRNLLLDLGELLTGGLGLRQPLLADDRQLGSLDIDFGETFVGFVLADGRGDKFLELLLGIFSGGRFSRLVASYIFTQGVLLYRLM